MAKKLTSDNTVCRNRRASHRFQIIETIECGIVLVGTEVKGLRERTASIEEAYAYIIENELWLIGSHIPAYRFGHSQNHEPTRRRKLLVRARELEKLRQRVEMKGLTLVPLNVHFNDRGIAKLKLGLARGKNTSDKRQDLQARDHKREMDRAMHRRR